MHTIASLHNPQLKHLIRLIRQSRYRRSQAQTVLEGTHLLAAYLDSGRQPEHVYVPHNRLAHPEVAALLQRLPPERIVLLDGSLNGKIGSLEQNQDDVFTLIGWRSAAVLPQQGDCVVLDRVQDPGNIGTVLRSAAAAGIRQIILGQGSADAASPKVLRAAMGAHFLLDIYEQADLTAWLAQYRGTVYATALNQPHTRSLYQLDLHQPAAWLFGNEGSGIDAALLAQIPNGVRIPMAGATESLNIAMAATVCLFEQLRQRFQDNRNEF